MSTDTWIHTHTQRKVDVVIWDAHEQELVQYRMSLSVLLSSLVVACGSTLLPFWMNLDKRGTCYKWYTSFSWFIEKNISLIIDTW
jgi:hypothetical protein